MNENYDKEDIKAAIDTLRNGGIIVYPTDTIWGIGCDARNEAAVKKVFEIKRRADSKSMILLVDAPGRIPLYIDAMPDIAWDLIECSDTPTTIIYSKAKGLAPNVIAEDGTSSVTASLCHLPLKGKALIYIRSGASKPRIPMITLSTCFVSESRAIQDAFFSSSSSVRMRCS